MIRYTKYKRSEKINEKFEQYVFIHRLLLERYMSEEEKDNPKVFIIYASSHLLICI